MAFVVIAPTARICIEMVLLGIGIVDVFSISRLEEVKKLTEFATRGIPVFRGAER